VNVVVSAGTTVRGDGRIEHTRMREVIKTADWMLDLGPEGGDKGGEIVADGTPEDVAREPRSYTGAYLKDLLAKSFRAEQKPVLTKAVRRRIKEAAE
jgi:excinuclease ABC subunit A